MKNYSHNSTITFAIAGFVLGLLLNVAGALLNYYASLKGPLFQFLDYSFDSMLLKLSPVYLSILLLFVGFIKMKLCTFNCLRESICQVNEAIIIINVDRVVQWANEGFTNTFGYSLKEIMNKDISEILRGPLTNKDIARSMQVKLLKGEIVRGDLVIYHKSGEPIWISASVTPIFDNSSNIKGYIAINKNISQQKTKELSIDALYKEIADYKYALDQSCSVITFDLDGNILKANANFCSTNAIEEIKIIGRNFSLINTSMGNYSIAKPIWNALLQGLTWKGELINRNVNGKIFWAYTIIVPILNETGNPYQFLLIEKDITERMLLENQLKINTHKLQTAMQIGLIGFWEIDINGIITISDELRTIIKEPLNSTIDLAYLFERISPEDVEMVQNNLITTRTTFQRNDMEFKFLVHGDIHYLTTSNAAQFNMEGDFIGHFGTIQDVTAFKLIELALIKSQEEKAAAMQIAKIGSWEINIDGILTLSNELKELIHEPLNDQIDLPYVFKRMLPEEVMIMQNNLTSTSTTFQKNEMEFQYLVHGKTHYFTSSCTAQFNQAGKFKGLFGAVQDITTIKLIALELKKNEEEKAVILNNTQAIICIYEMDGTMIYINNAAENLLGLTNQEAIGLNIKSFIDVNDIRIINEYFTNVNTTDKVSGKIHLITKTGEKRLCLYKNNIYANNGNNPYVIASAIDITSIEVKL